MILTKKERIVFEAFCLTKGMDLIRTDLIDSIEDLGNGIWKIEMTFLADSESPVEDDWTETFFFNYKKLCLEENF